MEQEKLAKRFAKRARMQRLLETYADDEAFSQGRMIDQDEKMKQELRAMKDGLSRSNTRMSSISSREESQGDSQKSAFNSQSTSLSLALRTNSRKPKKTSFLGGGTVNKERASASQKSVALNHVVFQASTEASQQSKGETKRKHQNRHGLVLRKKRSLESSSLWDKVSRNSFRKRKR